MVQGSGQKFKFPEARKIFENHISSAKWLHCIISLSFVGWSCRIGVSFQNLDRCCWLTRICTFKVISSNMSTHAFEHACFVRENYLFASLFGTRFLRSSLGAPLGSCLGLRLLFSLLCLLLWNWWITGTLHGQWLSLFERGVILVAELEEFVNLCGYWPKYTWNLIISIPFILGGLQ